MLWPVAGETDSLPLQPADCCSPLTRKLCLHEDLTLSCELDVRPLHSPSLIECLSMEFGSFKSAKNVVHMPQPSCCCSESLRSDIHGLMPVRSAIMLKHHFRVSAYVQSCRNTAATSPGTDSLCCLRDVMHTLDRVL